MITLNEGGNYSFSFKVRNTSTRSGSPVGVTLRVTYQVIVGGVLLVNNTVDVSFTAGQERLFGPDIPFTVPLKAGGQSGAIEVLVDVPATGALVASGSQFFNVASALADLKAILIDEATMTALTPSVAAAKAEIIDAATTSEEALQLAEDLNWVPDFSSPDPYANAPAAYIELEQAVYVPTEEFPLPPSQREPVLPEPDYGWVPEPDYGEPAPEPPAPEPAPEPDYGWVDYEGF